MTVYAKETDVSAEKSRAEIETLLNRYGADSFGYMTDRGDAVVMFRVSNRTVRFKVTMPDKKDQRFWRYKTGQHSHGTRTPEAAQKQWEQVIRQQWRALALVVKAKLEAVSSNITTFEAEFLAHIVLPDGRTMGEWAAPQLEAIAASNLMPRNLLMLGPAPATEAPAVDAEIVP